MKLDKQYLLNAPVAAAGLLILAVPMLFAAAAIRLTSPGPALFKQQRYGLKGEPFVIYKFRTMTMAQPRQSPQERITALGAFLRRHCLDELPQFYNILKGDMVFIGPRPLPYEPPLPNYRERYRVKPGMLGLAQVELKSRKTKLICNSPEHQLERHKYDMAFVRNRHSTRLKLEILFRTAALALSNNDDLASAQTPRRESRTSAVASTRPIPR